jgi:hypothetical protein
LGVSYTPPVFIVPDISLGALRGLYEDMIQDETKEHDIEQMGHNA